MRCILILSVIGEIMEIQHIFQTLIKIKSLWLGNQKCRYREWCVLVVCSHAVIVSTDRRWCITDDRKVSCQRIESGGPRILLRIICLDRRVVTVTAEITNSQNTGNLGITSQLKVPRALLHMDHVAGDLSTFLHRQHVIVRNPCDVSINTGIGPQKNGSCIVCQNIFNSSPHQRVRANTQISNRNFDAACPKDLAP